MSKLRLVPMRFKEAAAFVVAHHRHHKPPTGMIAAVGCAADKVHGVAIVGRPVARLADDGCTLELLRLCTDGERNAASFLLGAARRLVFALGYDRLITYTLPSESGASLRAAGYQLLGERGGGSWSRSGRPRVDCHPTQCKLLWEAPPPR